MVWNWLTPLSRQNWELILQCFKFLPKVSGSIINLPETPLKCVNYFFPEEIDLQQKSKTTDKKLKKVELIAIELCEVLQQEKPFNNVKLNTQLFERMLQCIRDSSTHSTLSLPAIFVLIALIHCESESLTATRMATHFVDGLFGMIENAKVFKSFGFELRVFLMTILNRCSRITDKWMSL